MTTTQPPALLPCPFCGAAAHIAHSEDQDGCYWAKVRCSGCGVESRGRWASNRSTNWPIFYGEVRDEWNTRTTEKPPALQDDLRARLDSFVTGMEGCDSRYGEPVRTYTRKLRHLLTETALSTPTSEAVAWEYRDEKWPQGEWTSIARQEYEHMLVPGNVTGPREGWNIRPLYTTPQPSPAAMVEGLLNLLPTPSDEVRSDGTPYAWGEGYNCCRNQIRTRIAGLLAAGAAQGEK